MKKNQKLRVLVALSIIPGFGSRRVKELLKHIEEPEEIFNTGKRALRTIEGIGEASALSILSFKNWEKVDAIIAETENKGIKLVTLTDPDYPELLKQIYDPPVLFWMKGNPEALSQPGVAVVGTRNASPYGRKMATKLTGELADKGLSIFSGLAYGIDAIAHRTAIEHNAPTVAVLGSGIDNLYPQKHAKLANDIIASGGAVISEFPLGTNPDAGNFPVRNRIVSGMSLGVLVVESGIKGGSMITADLGLNQNREVFAVPHPLGSPSGTGCNYLIKRGAAKLVQTVDDILVELPIAHNEVQEPEDIKKVNWRELNLEEHAAKVCEMLEKQAFQIDDLSEKTGIATGNLLVTLLQLEMDGIVQQKAGKVFELK